MITEEDLAHLKGLSSEHRFQKLERILRSRWQQERVRARNRDEPARYSEYDHAAAMSAAAHEFGIVELMDFDISKLDVANSEYECRQFLAKATHVSQRLLLRQSLNSEMVSLDGPTKKKITHWLQQMREAIQAADVAAEKKDRLFKLIKDLQAEVDRERTPVHAAGKFFVTLCTYMGDGTAKALDPVMPHIVKICEAIGIAKDAEEADQGKLPPRKEPKRIEGPDKSRDNSDKPPDEEIPF